MPPAHLLAQLCSGSCQARQSPGALLQVMLRLAESPAFVAAMAAQQDYEASVLQKTHKILTEKSLGEYAHAARLQALIEQVRNQGVASGGMLGLAAGPYCCRPSCRSRQPRQGQGCILMACLGRPWLHCSCRPDGCFRQGQDCNPGLPTSYASALGGSSHLNQAAGCRLLLELPGPHV